MAEERYALEARNLSKRFGSRAAVDDVSLRVPYGSVFGFLGPNGAGKTTLIRMLLGLAKPTNGQALLLGYDVSHERGRALGRVGAIVEEPRFYPYLSGRANLEIWADTSPAPGPARARIDEVLARMELDGRAKDKVKAYSAGMRQRLGVARALLGDPELLILDEPTNGLDATGRVEFRDTIRALVEREGRTVFLSSHLLDEMQRVCDHVAIVDHGKTVAEGSLGDLLEHETPGFAFDVDDPEGARAALAELSFVEGVEVEADSTLIVRCVTTRELAFTLSRALAEAGVGVASMVPRRATLEDRYLQLTGVRLDAAEAEKAGGPGS